MEQKETTPAKQNNNFGADPAVVWITKTYNQRKVPQVGDVVYKYFPFSDPNKGNYRPCVFLKNITKLDATYVPTSAHDSVSMPLLKVFDEPKYFRNGSLNVRFNYDSGKFERKGYLPSFCEHPHITRCHFYFVLMK